MSACIQDDLQRRAQRLAERQGVSLDRFVNAIVAAAVAQEDALAFLGERVRDVDQAALHQHVLGFMRDTRSGCEPTAADIERAVRE